MSTRNFILLILVLTIATLSVLGFWYFQEDKITPTDPGEGTNFFSQFNPFGTSKPNPDTTTTPPVDVSGYVPPEGETQTGKLRKISSMPVAGFGLFQKERIIELETSTPETTPPTNKPTQKTEFATAVRYVEKAKGLIYQTFADQIQERKFSTTTIPKIYDAYFGNKGESVVMRYLKEDNKNIETFVGTLPKETLGDITGNKEIKGSFLPNNIKDLSISPDGSKVFYLFLNGTSGENMIGTILNLSNNSKIQLIDSSFTEWSAHWGSSNIITLTTKPASGIAGHAYTLDVAKKSLIRTLGGINGLTTLSSPNGKSILYTNDSLSLSIYQNDTHTSSPLAIRTLPEKCIWNKTSENIYCAVPKLPAVATYPDSWYQGEVSFNDQIWKIDTKTGNATLIIDLAGGGEIDGTKLALDEKEFYLFFINKKDNFLWKLDLK